MIMGKEVSLTGTDAKEIGLLLSSLLLMDAAVGFM
jgi:hypothetical protein